MRSPRKRAAAPLAAFAAGVLALSACAGGGEGRPAGRAAPGSTEDSGQSTDRATTQDIQAVSKVAVGTTADSRGPAAPEPGAARGGTVTLLDRDDFPHLDPARIYTNYTSMISKLFTRQLTDYKIAPDGSIKLVGDLAVAPGRTRDGGRTWTFVLKKGLRWQDGSPITAADIKHTFERIFAPFTAEGPPYAERYLLPRGRRYAGPYTGRHLNTVRAVGQRTVVFRLDRPRPDFNFTVAMTGYGAVPRGQDTRARYDRQPFSSGPYKISRRVLGRSLELERNEHWDPATDPIRNAYPDRWRVELGVQTLQATDRLIADNGPDRTAMSFSNRVAPERLREVVDDPELSARTVRGLTPYTTYYTINTTRVPSLNVRRAIVKAFPMRQVRQLQGGEVGLGQYASTVTSPTVLGHRPYDLYGQLTRPEGDPEGARELLAAAGRRNPRIVYAYNQTPVQERVAVAIKTGLEKAGFTVVTKPLNPATYYDAIGQLDNPYDLYWGGWGADWPTGAAALTPYDGRRIADHAPNHSHLDDPAVNEAIDRAERIADPVRAGRAWARIDRMIMRRAPVVPAVYQTFLGLYGSGLGGVRLDPIKGMPSPGNVFVKQ